MNKKINIGITLFLRDGQSIWSNGAAQNCIYLYLLLKQIPDVEIFLINGGDAKEIPPGLMLQDIKPTFYKMSEVADKLDLLIEAWAQISAKEAGAVQAHGGKVISYKFGNAYVIDTERIIHNKSSGGIVNGTKFDEIWTNSQHCVTNYNYWELLYRAPVKVLPHIWNPYFLDRAIGEFTPNIKAGYNPPHPTKRRIVIMEPNINIVKTCMVPLLICEKLYRKSPGLIDSVWVTNALEIKEHETFKYLVSSLDLERDKICSFEGRYNLPYFMAKYGDIIVTHQWENNLNYMYYDALYLGYPLVHNTPHIPPAVNYYYDGFDIDQGARALELAITSHDDTEYRIKAQKVLDQHSINNVNVQSEYMDAIRSLLKL